MHQRELFLRHFFNRIDVVAVLAPWGRPCPVDAIGKFEELVDGHLCGPDVSRFQVYRHDEGHRHELLEGPFRIGTYSPDTDGCTRWASIDIDGAGHSNPVADPAHVAFQIKSTCKNMGIPAYMEKSGGGNGWHIWIFFSNPIPAVKVRQFAILLAPTDALLANGGLADAAKSAGIEIFPKQDRIAPDGFGNFVWLPRWHGGKDGATQFHRLENGSGPLVYVPESFDTVSEDDVDRILSRYTATQSPSQQKKPKQRSNDDTWRLWREAALKALRLEDIFGEWLTGRRKRKGWLECRDPLSQSGDQNPSAGVADETPDVERGTFHSFRDGRTLSVFDFLIERGLALEFRDACRVIAELSGVRPPSGTPPRPARELPRIQINNRQLRDLAADAWRAIDDENTVSPSLFTRGGELVRIADCDSQLCIEPHNEASIIGHLARTADWIRVNEKGTSSVTPSKDVAKDLLAYPARRLPRLEAILRTPVFAAGGDLLSEDGYHPGHGLWLEGISSLGLPTIPQAPSRDDIARARRLICDELLGEFPFVGDADRSHVVAALLLPAVRRLIEGVTPLHVISAPIAGSGKGLLCDVTSILHTGRACPVQPISAKEEEIRKVITSQLSLARPIILLDNARERQRIDSASLAAALTAETWTDRILSESRNATLPNRALWLLTGNNPQFSTELARRSVRIRIDPQRDQPWLRTGFRYQNLRAWTLEHRPDILAALFVLVRAWQRAGCPHNPKELGSYERWSQVIGGILMVVEIPGFLGNLDEFYASSDDEGQMWRDFVRAWWEKFDSIPKRVVELNTLCEEQDLMIAVRSDGSAKSQETRLGVAIKRACDRVYDGKKIVLAKDAGGRGKHYRLIQVCNSEDGRGVTFDRSVEPLEQGYAQGYTAEVEHSQAVPVSV